MREIKFRAWDINNEVMEYGVSVDNGRPVKEGYQLYHTGNTVYHSQLMQFTGLTDVNGKEIYEGDIVKLLTPDRYYTIQANGYMDVGYDEGFESVGEVKFMHSMWFIGEDDRKGCPLDFDTDQKLEVIGNIYEHKHLLKENEK